VRSINEQTIAQEFAQLIAELTARVAELTRRVDSIEFARSESEFDPQPATTVYEADEWSHPIEFLTENGWVIVRPWETNGSPPPAGGICQFQVSDPEGHERPITVHISRELISQTAAKSKTRIDASSSFWICCAERQLGNYVAEHDCFPEANQLTIAELDREEVLLAISWGKRDWTAQ
jgi:hypothetical protein